MDDTNTLNRSIDDAKKHYTSMFTLPSLKKALGAVAAVCLVIGLLTYAVPSQSLIRALLLALSLFVLTVIADLMVSKLVLRKDPIFQLRRIHVLSLFSLVFWIIFVIVGVILGSAFSWQLLEKLTLVGFGAIVTLRVIVFMARLRGPMCGVGDFPFCFSLHSAWFPLLSFGFQTASTFTGPAFRCSLSRSRFADGSTVFLPCRAFGQGVCNFLTSSLQSFHS